MRFFEGRPALDAPTLTRAEHVARYVHRLPRIHCCPADRKVEMEGFLVPKVLPGATAASLNPVRPTFAVIIPTYNDHHLLPDALRSLTSQTEAPAQIVVVDDGSDSDVRSALGDELTGVTLIELEHGGVARARNAGVAAATADFVVLLDADDVWHPDRLRRLADLAQERPDIDVLCTDGVIEADGATIGTCYPVERPFPVERQKQAVVTRNFIVNSAAFRRTRWLELGGSDPSLKLASDWDLLGKFVLAGGQVGCVPEALMTYRLRPGRLTTDHVRRLQGRVAVLRRFTMHPELDEAERQAAVAALGAAERALAARTASRAIEMRDPAARSLAWTVARDRTQSGRVRLRAAVGAAIPGLAGRIVSARSASGVEVVSGRRVKSD